MKGGGVCPLSVHAAVGVAEDSRAQTDNAALKLTDLQLSEAS